MQRNKRTPSLSSSHPPIPLSLKTLKAWIDEDGEPCAVHEEETIVHRAARDMSSGKFHEFCCYVIDELKVSELFKPKEAKWKSPLHFILSKQKILEARTLQMILDIPGLNVDETDNHENTLLLRAVAMRQSTDIISTLIKAGSCINACNKRGESCLHLAAKLADAKAICSFISLGVDPNLVDKEGSSFLHLCARQGITAEQYQEIIKLLFSRKNTNVFKSKDKCNDLPVHKMVGYIDINRETMTVFRLGGVDVNLVNGQGKSLLLCAAEGQRSIPFLRLLLAMGVDVMMKDERGNTFAHSIALSYSTVDYHAIVVLLFEKGHGNIFTEVNCSGQNPLHLALHFVEVLPKTLNLIVGDKTFDGSSVINAVDKDGDSTLHWAVRGKRSLQLVRNLISLGADSLAINHHGTSLAHYSAALGLDEHLRHFVGLGCDVNAVDDDGDNVLQCAIHDAPKNIVEIVKFLVNAGAKANHENKVGKTAFDYLRERAEKFSKEDQEKMGEGHAFSIKRALIEDGKKNDEDYDFFINRDIIKEILESSL